MKFTSSGTRNASDSVLWYRSHIKVLTAVPQKELLFTNITRNPYDMCRFPSSEWCFKDGVQTHKVVFIESYKFSEYDLDFTVCKTLLHPTLSPPAPSRALTKPLGWDRIKALCTCTQIFLSIDISLYILASRPQANWLFKTPSYTQIFLNSDYCWSVWTCKRATGLLTFWQH